MSDEESGGVRGLRAWVADVNLRVAELIKRVPRGAVSPEEFERTVAELTTLRDLLDHDRALLGLVTARLGALLALRHASGHGTPEHRERAHRLLSEVRDPSTAAGEAVSADERRWAALFLLMVSDSVPPGGAAPDFWSIFDRSRREEPEAVGTAVAEFRALVAEVEGLPLPSEALAKFGQMRDVLSRTERTGFSEPQTLLGMLPEDSPFTEELRLLVNMMQHLPDTVAPQPATPDTNTDTDTVAAAWLASVLGATEALRTGDPEALSRLLHRLGTELDRLPDGQDRAAEIQNLMSLVLQMGQMLSGSHQDGTVARDHMKSMTDHFEQWSASDPAAVELAVGARVMNLLAKVREAEAAGSEQELARLVGELESLEPSTPAGHTFRPMVLLALGSALGALGSCTGDIELLVRGFAYQERGFAVARAENLGLPETLLTSVKDSLRSALAHLVRAPDLMPEHTPAPPDATADALFFSGLSATLRYSATRDPADLDAAIGELEQVRERVRQGRSPHLAAHSLWQLAENYRARLSRTQDAADREAATDAALESLRALAGDVVLQTGPDHGLLAARNGVNFGVRAANWAAAQGRVDDAVTALELGRALVLQAASTSRAVPELLEARGHHELAREWRSAGAGGDRQLDTLPRELPSSLRRRALEALGHREPGGALFHTPTLDELKAGVAQGHADALVYLLAGQGALPGMAIVVGPGTGTGVRALPLLSAEESGPLERYLDAAAQRQQSPGSPSAAQAWEQALSELCDWATGAVIAPVLTDVTERLAANDKRRRDRPGPPRIVLVPCGRLGIVPWHAARLPPGAPSDYACQIMVTSYAASGRQFLDAVRRARRTPAADPVLVADPDLSLTHAELEVTALQQAFYPQARLYGEFYEPPVEPEAPGTPDDLLDALGGTPSLLHVACHGSAGTSPTASALQLAFPSNAAQPSPDGSEPGARPDSGRLTVARLLDRRAVEQDAADGPLVVLSACETDLSNRDHDEALTLTTAFLAGGARDVVGSRWATQDSAAALMMAVFHHYLSVEGHSPVDALRATQMWMLDPDRRNPGSLSGSLLDELNKGPRLDHPAAWAAFIHQGHPGPSAY